MSTKPGGTSSRQQLQKKVRGLLLLSILVCLGGWQLFQLDAAKEIEARTWDWRLDTVAEATVPDPRIKIIAIDQGSLDHMAEARAEVWPWPRAYYEAVILFLKHAGARGVAFDMLYTEPSSYGVDDDNSFASSFEDIPVILAAALRSSEGDVDAEEFEILERKQKALKQDTEALKKFLLDKSSETAQSVVLPIKTLLNETTAVGNVKASADTDGVFRHAVPGGYFRDIPLLSLPFSLYYETLVEKDVLFDGRQSADGDGRFAIRFAGRQQSYETYPIDAIIESFIRINEGETPYVDPKIFKGAYVFLGATAPGLMDLRPTPIDEQFPGVEINATILDNILNHSFVIKLSPLWSMVIVALLVVLTGCSGLIVRRTSTQFLFLFFGLVLYVYLSIEMAVAGYWMPMFVPMSAMLVSFMCAMGYQYYLEGRQHRFLKSAFQHYVNPSVIDQIILDSSLLSLGGSRRELTIFFSDIAGFTSLSEKMDPTQLVSLLNEYLTAMTEIILESGGTLDKYEGDAIIAFWNAPLPVDDHAFKAVVAALRCKHRLDEMQEYFNETYGVELQMRMGLHTGVVTVGNFGSKDRFDYTIIGDAANLAARLEGVNKVFGTSILISGVTNRALNNAVFTRKLGDIRVVGREESVEIFEPMTPPDYDRRNDSLAMYEECRLLFERGELEKALAGFSSLNGDPVAAAYCERIQNELRGENWTAVWNLTEK